PCLPWRSRHVRAAAARGRARRASAFRTRARRPLAHDSHTGAKPITLTPIVRTIARSSRVHRLNRASNALILNVGRSVHCMTPESRRTPDENVIGTVIGRYKITKVLNQGGMGAVYRAEHPLIGKPAVIKLLLPDLSSHEEMVHRFFNEAKAASAIRHPG